VNIRNAMQNLGFHFKYLEYLLKDKDYLVADTYTSCDFLAAASLSVLDYLGLLNLDDYPKLQEWYFKLKSRPSFKNLLKDHIVGLTPHENYKLLDV
jgi:glutathione S-transferase